MGPLERMVCMLQFLWWWHQDHGESMVNGRECSHFTSFGFRISADQTRRTQSRVVEIAPQWGWELRDTLPVAIGCHWLPDGLPDAPQVAWNVRPKTTWVVRPTRRRTEHTEHTELQGCWPWQIFLAAQNITEYHRYPRYTPRV